MSNVEEVLVQACVHSTSPIEYASIDCLAQCYAKPLDGMNEYLDKYNISTVGPEIFELTLDKTGVYRGMQGSRQSVVGPKDILNPLVSFCRQYLAPLVFVDLMGSANCGGDKTNCGDSILPKCNNYRFFSTYNYLLEEHLGVAFGQAHRTRLSEFVMLCNF